MEDDIPLWHFDIEEQDMPALVARPAEFLQGSGIAEFDETQYDVTFVANRKTASSEGAHLCCYQSGSQTICHYHEA
jgi:hypothetical protein